MINKKMILLKVKNKIKNTSSFNKLKQFKIYFKIRNSGKQTFPLHILLTLNCTLRCSYCVNEFNSKNHPIKNPPLASAKNWINFINKKSKDVIFTGGEPTLHPEFIQLLNGIDKKLSVFIYTNFCWREDFLEKFIQKIKRPVKFYGSYHVCSGKPERVLKTINSLRDNNLFDGVIHTVETKENHLFLQKVVKEFKENKWHLIVNKNQFDKQYPASSLKFKKRAKCSGQEVFFAPDGEFYPCLSKLLRQKDSLGNVFKNAKITEPISIICSEYGFCSPCDCEGSKDMELLE